MRVGIDYRVAAAHAPGIGRYVRELTRALIALDDPGLGLALVDVGREPDSVSELALGLSCGTRRPTRLRLAIPRGAAVAAGKFGLSVERFVGDLSIFHHAKPPFLPVERARPTLAIGDLPSDPLHRAELAEAASSCAAVFVFAESARATVARELALDPGRVIAVPVGADHWARELTARDSVLLSEPPRILVLGAMTARREPARLLGACRELAHGGLDFELVFAGRRIVDAPEFLNLAEDPALSLRTKFIEPSESEMPELVASSAVMVHLDREALTPVTPLEACAAGCGVVVTESPVFREALADDARFVSEDDPLAAAIESELVASRDATARDRRRDLARAYSWERNARATLAVWRDLR